MQRRFHSHLKNILPDTHELHLPRDAEIFDYHYLDHTALMPGYLPVDSVRWIEYSGRFGKGFIVLRHNPQSTRFVFKDYWIEGDEPKEVIKWLEEKVYPRQLEKSSTNGNQTKSPDSSSET